jgi:hypothetical protein
VKTPVWVYAGVFAAAELRPKLRLTAASSSRSSPSGKRETVGELKHPAKVRVAGSNLVFRSKK